MSDDAIKVFIGCAPDGMDAEAQAVVEFSMRSRSSMPIDLIWAIESADPTSYWYGWNTQLWTTPFSGFRWRVPEACGFEGKAIYTDSDIIYLADIAELWNTEIEPGKVVVARGGWRYCVCLWDCRAARSHILSPQKLLGANGHRAQTQYFMQRPHLTQPFRAAWNSVDGEFPLSSTKALHYSSIPTQPSTHLATARLAKQGRKHWHRGHLVPHPKPWVSSLFDRELKAAIAAGYTIDRYADSGTI